MGQRYEGYGGQIVVEGDRLVLLRDGLTARALGLAGPPRMIPLAALTDVSAKKATLLANGYVRLGLDGAHTGEPLVKDAARDPDTVLFTYQNRRAFDQLYEWLTQVVQINRRNASRSLERPGSSPITQVPRTLEQQLDLVTQQPAAWEYRLFAGVLLQEREALEHKWRDHELRYAPRSGLRLNASEVFPYLSRAIPETLAIADGAMRIMDERNIERAFGPPGIPGDAARIEHLARRLIHVYEELLDWAAALRGITVPDEFKDVFELAARTMDRPLQDIRRFVDRCIHEIERLPTVLETSRDRPIFLTLKLTLTADRRAVDDYVRALKRAKRGLSKR